MSPERRATASAEGEAEMRVVRDELVPGLMPMTGTHWEEGREGLCLHTKALPEWRMPAGGRGASAPCGPLPSSSLGSGPSTRGVKMAQTRGGECPAQQGGAGCCVALAARRPGAGGQGKATSGGCLEGRKGGEGDKPEAGLAEGLTGSSTTLA